MFGRGSPAFALLAGLSAVTCAVHSFLLDFVLSAVSASFPVSLRPADNHRRHYRLRWQTSGHWPSCPDHTRNMERPRRILERWLGG